VHRHDHFLEGRKLPLTKSLKGQWPCHWQTPEQQVTGESRILNASKILRDEFYIVSQSGAAIRYIHFYRSEEDDFQLAMQLSKSMMEKATSSASLPKPSEAHNLVDQSNIVSEEDELQRAIAMSLEG